jgi:Bacterial protein of unknown function (Gcw_chp).
MKLKSIAFSAAALVAAALTVNAQEAAPAAAEKIAEPVVEAGGAAEVFASVDIASAMLYRGGSIHSDSLVIQPYLGVGFDSALGIPLTFSVWANYSTEGKDDGATQKHAFTEVDFSIGTSFDLCGGLSASVSLDSWQYPNMTGWNGEELISVGLSKTRGDFTIGADFEYMLTGDFEGDCSVYPYAEFAKSIEKIGFGLKAGPGYTVQSGDVDAWTAWTVRASVSYAEKLSFYVMYWGQMSDKIYTDEEHDNVNTVVGISYGIPL